MTTKLEGGGGLGPLWSDQKKTFLRLLKPKTHSSVKRHQVYIFLKQATTYYAQCRRTDVDINKCL